MISSSVLWLSNSCQRKSLQKGFRIFVEVTNETAIFGYRWQMLLLSFVRHVQLHSAFDSRNLRTKLESVGKQCGQYLQHDALHAL